MPTDIDAAKNFQVKENLSQLSANFMWLSLSTMYLAEILGKFP